MKERLKATNQTEAAATRIADGLTRDGQAARIVKQPNGKFNVVAFPAPVAPIARRAVPEPFGKRALKPEQKPKPEMPVNIWNPGRKLENRRGVAENEIAPCKPGFSQIKKESEK